MEGLSLLRMSGPLLENSKAGPGVIWGLIHFKVWWLMLAVSWGLGSSLCAPTLWASGVFVTAGVWLLQAKCPPKRDLSGN